MALLDSLEKITLNEMYKDSINKINWITVKDYAEKYKVSKATVLNHIKDNKLVGRNFNGLIHVKDKKC